MVSFRMKNWDDVKKAQFLLEKNSTVYAYAIDQELLIGTAEEIYSEIENHSDTANGVPMGKYTVSIEGGFLVQLKVKSII